MSDEAVNQQSKPRGTGRFVHELQKEDVLTEDFLLPERGLLTVELWMRSAALYLKTRLSPGLDPVSKIEADPALAHAIIRDIQARADWGTKKYGEALRAHNGRSALVDAYQEVLDAWVYLRQNREEKEIKK